MLDIEELVRSYSASSVDVKTSIENTVIEVYTPMVHKIANRYRNASRNWASDIQDRIQDGFQGLLLALRSYDPEFGVKFLTYAFGYVRKAVYLGVRNLNTPGKSKAYRNSELQKYLKIKNELYQQNGRIPSIHELAAATGWKVNKVLSFERQIQSVISLDYFLIDERSSE